MLNKGRVFCKKNGEIFRKIIENAKTADETHSGPFKKSMVLKIKKTH